MKTVVVVQILKGMVVGLVIRVVTVAIVVWVGLW